MRTLLLPVAISFTARPFAQIPATGGPTLDVVSIKPSRAATGTGPFIERPDGGFSVTAVTVTVLIARAYPPTIPAEIVGVPGWARTERYDVRTTASLPSATVADRAAVLRAMLADRFMLAAHFERREQSVYNLVMARDDRRLGAGLSSVAVDCAAVRAAREATNVPALSDAPRAADFNVPPPPCTFRIVAAPLRDLRGDQQGRLGDLLEGDITMDDLATALRAAAGCAVVNKTELPGTYHVTMNFQMRPALRASDSAGSVLPGGTSVFTALQEQLGLKLESARAERETLVIDRLQRPTED